MILGPNDPRAIRICDQYGLPHPTIIPLTEVLKSAGKKASKSQPQVDLDEAQMALEILGMNGPILDPSQILY
jgi:glutamyl/glutaminyl-tRNA synthetase